MSGVESAALDRAIAATLADLVTAAAIQGAPATAFTPARDAAQILSLEGLDHALAACAAHAGDTWPADVAALADRLARLAATARESGTLVAFRAADSELNALAGELDGYARADSAGSDTNEPAGTVTLGVDEVLEDLPLAGDESRAVARRSRLPVPVAAAVRAAIDWLVPPGGVAPVRLHGEPSLLELRLDRIRTDRLYAVHRVIAAASGNIGPALDGAGWVLRVPSFADRPIYLMLVQGGVRIAVPWHAVLKLRIVSTHGTPTVALPVEHPMLFPLAGPSIDAPEHPVVLIGHGLKRAWLAADRLIWRMSAEACENEWGSPGGGLTETVRTDDGEVFWAADPARLLAGVDLPDLATTPEDAAPEPRALSEVDVQPLETADDAFETSRLATLVPLAAVLPPVPLPMPPPSVPLPTAVESARTREAPPVATPATTRALIADDSFTTRLLLARLLEGHGFVVETVATSAELMSRLDQAPWTVVFTDLELPDGSGPEWLRGVCREAASRPGPVPVVALVRDGGDLDVARAAGIEDTLLKPFARESLGALLARYGWLRR